MFVTKHICQVKQLLVGCGAEELVPVFAKKKVIGISVITVTIILLSSLPPYFLSHHRRENEEEVFFNFLRSCYNEIINSVT